MPRPLIIDNFQRGMGKSSHTGFMRMKNIDIDTVWGAARPSFLGASTSASLTDKALKFTLDPVNNHIYTVESDSNTNVVRRSTDAGGSWGTIAGNTTSGVVRGLEFWKSHALFFKDDGATGTIDAYDGSWNLVANATLPDDGSYYPSVIIDDIVYIGAGRFISTLAETQGDDFEAEVDASHLFTAQALDLPEDFEVRSLIQFGQYLMIGANRTNDTQQCYIFPWDRLSQQWNNPIIIPDNTLHHLFIYNNNPYVACGKQLRFYQINLTTYRLAAEMPKDAYPFTAAGVPQPFTSGLDLSPYSVMQLRDKVFFGFGGVTQPATPPQGVWTFNGDRFVHENVISIGDGEATNTATTIHSLFPINEYQYLIGWQYLSAAPATTYDIDKVGLSNYHTGSSPTYGGYIDTPFYSVGTKLEPETFKSVEVHLTQPNKGVAISYRRAKNDSFTLLKNFDSSTYPDETMEDTSIALTVDNVQFRIGINSSTSSLTELLRIILK